MAAPITHIVLTQLIFDKYFSDKAKREFYIGTSFPDIRYLGVIDRDRTHFVNLTLPEIQNEESFVAGLKFHSYLDAVREHFTESSGVYDRMPKSPYTTQALKFLEDEFLVDKIADWDPYIEYFNTVLDEEKKFGIAIEDLERWHRIIKQTFGSKPSPEGVSEFIELIGRPKEMAEEINKIVRAVRNDNFILSYIERLYLNFPDFIS